MAGRIYKHQRLVRRTMKDLFSHQIEKLTFGSGPPEVPKLTLRFCPWLGGLPPLAGGCGIGDGELAGDVIRGFEELCTLREPACCAGCCGVALDARGEPSAL